MKKLLLIFALSAVSILVKAQLSPVASKAFGTITDLRAQKGAENVQVLLQGLITIADQNGGIYYWNATSTDADDGFLTVKVTSVDIGRWKRMVNANTIKGVKTLSGTILQTAYPITFDNALPSAPAMVIIQAYSANAAVPSWVSNVTTTGFVANFASVPVIGTNNIVISYLIIKQ